MKTKITLALLLSATVSCQTAPVLEIALKEARQLLANSGTDLVSQASEAQVIFSSVVKAVSCGHLQDAIRSIESTENRSGYLVMTALRGDFIDVLKEEFDQLIAADSERWEVRTTNEVKALAQATGVEFPGALLLREGLDPLRDAASMEGAMFEYTLVAGTRAELSNDADKVHLWVDIKLSPFDSIDESLRGAAGAG